MEVHAGRALCLPVRGQRPLRMGTPLLACGPGRDARDGAAGGRFGGRARTGCGDYALPPDPLLTC